MTLRIAAGLCTILAMSGAQAQSTRPASLEVPAQYPSIQAAIAAARPGDSVIVAPGRYRESVRFGGKSIVLTSRYARTADPRDVLNTIIDGSRPTHPDSGSTVLIVDREDSTTVLQGFTIIGGPGTVWHDAAGRAYFREGGAILCELASPAIRYNRILGGHADAPRDGRVRSSGGGGIRCGYAEPTIEGNFIAGNRGRYGAGVVLFHSAAIVRQNLIAANAGGEDFGGAGAWLVGNLSRRLVTEFTNNTIVANRVIGADSGTDRTMVGKGGGVLLAGVNIRATENLVAANVQPAARQIAKGPSVQGRVEATEISAAAPDHTVGAFALARALLTPARTGAFSSAVPQRVRDLLAVLASSSDTVASAVAGPDLVARRRELLAADSAVGRGASTGIAHRLTEPLASDAIVIGPRTTLLRGSAAIRTALLGDTANAGATITWAPVKGDVSADGTEGYTFGYLDFSGGSSARREWKYMAYWKRDTVDGQWRVAAYKRLPREPGHHESAAPPGFGTPTTRATSLFPTGPAALTALMSLDSAFARAAQESPVNAFVGYTAQQGATLAAGPNIAWGPEKVAAEFSSFAPGTIDWAPDVAALAPSGDLGFATGEVIIRERGADGRLNEVVRSRYFTIWQRQSDGQWKLIIDG